MHLSTLEAGSLQPFAEQGNAVELAQLLRKHRIDPTHDALGPLNARVN
jgi:hypothetical protein